MYPRDAITYIADLTGASGNILASSVTPRTFLHIKTSCDNATDFHVRVGTAGTFYIHDTDANSKNSAEETSELQYSTTSAITYTNSITTATCYTQIVYVPRDRATTPDPVSEYATSSITFPASIGVNNFPSGFNINNFPALQPVSVNNFPALQDVRCTIGCDSSTTLILSSSTIEVLTTTAPTFQEWMLVVGVFLAINSIHMWNFLFRRPKTVIKANRIYK